MAFKMPFKLGIKKDLVFDKSYWRVDEIQVNFREEWARYKIAGYADAKSADDGSSAMAVMEFQVGPEEFAEYFTKGNDYAAACYEHAKTSAAIKTIGVSPVEIDVDLADGSKGKKLVPQPNVGPFDEAQDA